MPFPKLFINERLQNILNMEHWTMPLPASAHESASIKVDGVQANGEEIGSERVRFD